MSFAFLNNEVGTGQTDKESSYTFELLYCPPQLSKIVSVFYICGLLVFIHLGPERFMVLDSELE
jgi:hypothetical protein